METKVVYQDGRGYCATTSGSFSYTGRLRWLKDGRLQQETQTTIYSGYSSSFSLQWEDVPFEDGFVIQGDNPFTGSELGDPLTVKECAK